MADPKVAELVNFIVIGIFINKNTYIIPTNAYVTYRSVKDTDNVSPHFYLPPADRPGTGDYKMPSVRACVRPFLTFLQKPFYL